MFKQFLSKLPRKPSKSDNADSPGNSSTNCSTNAGVNAGQLCTFSGAAAASGAAARSASVKRMSSAVFPASVVAGIEPLLSFKEVPNAEKQSLFLSKLSLCCVVFDFGDQNKNAVEKDLKRQTLVEIVEYVASGSARFGEPVIAGICKMVAVNLFRVFPPSYRSNTPGAETEEEEPVFDPAWSHLQIVYELLLMVVASSSFDAKVAKKYIDHSFILRLLDLFDSEDPRERECLKTILHRIYGKFMVHRPFIRKAVSNIFYRFVFETEKHNGIAELLEIFGSVISGFALPLKEEHKMFLWRALIPLHKPKCVGSYLQQLSFCVCHFIEKEQKLASTVIRGLLKYWPVTNSQKEVMFLGELEEVLEATNMIEFQKCMVPLFRRIACCLNSSHFQVAERALFLWNNDHIVSLIAQNRQLILSIVYPALERNTRNHWNQTVLNLTTNVRKLFSEMDEPLLQTCESNFEEEETKLKLADEKRKLMWARLEAMAVCHPLAGNTAVLVTPLAAPSPIVVGGLN